MKRDVTICISKVKIWLKENNSPVAVIEMPQDMVEKFKEDLKDETLEYIDLGGFIFAKKDFMYATID